MEKVRKRKWDRHYIKKKIRKREKEEIQELDEDQIQKGKKARKEDEIKSRSIKRGRKMTVV
jgi:hypothetical protein